jgi:aryl-alcohol dehydrogenase-like predicted oxidoreductase
LLGAGISKAAARPVAHPILKRAIPASGERLPVIGLGTARTFNVAEADSAHAAAVLDVLRSFHEAGAEVIDIAPHGTVERVLGDGFARLGIEDQVFIAAKVIVSPPGADSKERGISLLEQSHQLLRRRRFDLLQVGNLNDVAVQLPTVLRWRDEGRARYAGITVSSTNLYADAERLLRGNRLEFIQLNYSLDARDAERTLLPLAAETGRAVLVNVPFGNGRLFQAVAGKSLPPWATELDIHSWAQFFLKFIISHPAVTAVLPATRNPTHMIDNLGAGIGRMPTESDRTRMIRFFEAL